MSKHHGIDPVAARKVYDACTEGEDNPPDGVVIWLDGRQFERIGGKWVELKQSNSAL